MIRVERPRDERERQTYLAWAAGQVPNISGWEDHAYPLVVRRPSGRDLAVAIYHQLRGGTVELSIIAIERGRWATKSVVRDILGFAFDVLRVRRVATITPESNNEALSLNERLGFTYEGTLGQAFEDEDGVLMALVRDDFEVSPWATTNNKGEAA